ncbi:MAG: hypothetical protein U0905_11880 [Pirellulales bacterium]
MARPKRESVFGQEEVAIAHCETSVVPVVSLAKMRRQERSEYRRAGSGRR